MRAPRASLIAALAVTVGHVLPNAIGPVLAPVGHNAAALLANAAVIGWVFAWLGSGHLGFDVALARVPADEFPRVPHLRALARSGLLK